ncbi:MAG: MBL fold metallo-hydrolase [Ignavibacteria bacterium]|nr:MBL fold metallo-hydrolase [Ignavibacteria bacterium]
MQVGKYQVHSLVTGDYALDGGAMFGVIPKPVWERNNPADSRNRVTLMTRSLLLLSDSRKILIDTGMGGNWDERSLDRYQVNNIPDPLTSFGITAADITDVLLTHLHFDHTGGSTIIENGKLIPAYPNARYYVQRNNFRWAHNPTERDKGSYIKEYFEPLAREGVLIPIDDDVDMLDDEIEVIQFNGHTYGQQLFRIFDDTVNVFFGSDLFPFSEHINLPTIMSYDLQPLITLQEKKEILPRIMEQEWILHFYHDPFHAGAKIEKTEKGFKVKEFIDDI